MFTVLYTRWKQEFMTSWCMDVGLCVVTQHAQ